MAIDLRRLFCVQLNPVEPEIAPETEEALRGDGWVESRNVFGPCLVAPKAMRDKLIPAIAHAIVHWAITSNQSRTFSLMETLAVAISHNANKIAGSIRARLSEEEDNRAIPIVEEEMDGVDSYVSLSAGAHIRTKGESATALDDAESRLIALLEAYPYENQMQ
jgi:hypothetical protein